MEMKDSHRLFLQSFMSRGLLGAKEVKLLYKTCCQKFEEYYPDSENERKNHLLELVQTINRFIHPFHMEIKKGVGEEDGVSYYCLVCTNESAITKLASDYSPNDLEYFKKLVESIVESDQGHIGSTAALNLTEKLQKKMSKDDAQNLLSRLEKAKWITLTSGRVSLSTRSLLELEQYILDMYEDSTSCRCNACKHICLKGQTCDNCGTKLHFYCASRFFRGMENPKCPNSECGTPWSHAIPNKETDSSQAHSSRDTTSSSRKRKERH